MKKNLKFDRSNIDSHKNRIKYVIKYFTTWYNLRDIRKSGSDPDMKKIWEKTVIAEITYNVMVLSVMGFQLL